MRDHVEVRRATAGDMDGVRAVARVYGTLDHWPDRPDYLDHELETGVIVVADQAGEVLGFAGALPRDGIWHLGDTFVMPDRLGEGIGRALVEHIVDTESERTVYASSDPRAAPLYRRFGMYEVCALHYLVAEGHVAARLPEPALSVQSVEAATLVELDARASARRRPEDLAFLARLPHAEAVVCDEDGEVVGHVTLRRVPSAGSVAAHVELAGAADDEHATAVVLAACRRAATHADRVHIALFEAHPALPELLDAGFDVADTDTFMASLSDLVDVRRYVPAPDLG